MRRSMPRPPTGQQSSAFDHSLLVRASPESVLGAFFDSRSGRFQPIRGEHNGARLPAFFAADVRAERRFRIASTRAAAYLEVQNLTSRANAEEIIYSADFSERGYLTSLPLLAIAGVRIEQ